MVATIEEMKKEILEWVNTTDDAAAIKHIYQLKAAYKTPFNFEEEWQKALTGEELMSNMNERMKAWPWKK
jgi:hypothetical protein